MRRAAAAVTLAALVGACAPAPARAATPTVVEVNAQARAAGNRRDEAIKIGRSLLATHGPAQVLKIRVDGIGPHLVAGIVLSGEKLREPVDAAGFLDQVIQIVDETFDAGEVEEVDVWATVPIPVAPGAIVSGDLAVPTSRTVFSASVRRTARQTYAAHLRAGSGVYWSPDWRAHVETNARAAKAPEPGTQAPYHADGSETLRAPGS
jgi:hypothetical protein